jgi:hypothetical protein
MAAWYAQDHERCYAGDLRPGLSMRRREFTNHSAATDWDEAPLGERDAIRSPEMLLQS